MESRDLDLPTNAGNRRQRRQFAKKLGLLKDKNKLPLKERMELHRRALLAGEQLHAYHTQNMENAKIEYQQALAAEKYDKEFAEEETTNNPSEES